MLVLPDLAVTDCMESGRLITLTSSADGSIALIAAGYDSENRLVDMVYQTADATVGTNVYDLGRGVSGDSVKVMVWSGMDSLIPLCGTYLVDTDR